MRNPTELRSLAAWYREFAERTGNPTIWECRLKTAEDLEQEAGRIEAKETAVWGRVRARVSLAADQ